LVGLFVLTHKGEFLHQEHKSTLSAITLLLLSGETPAAADPGCSVLYPPVLSGGEREVAFPSWFGYVVISKSPLKPVIDKWCEHRQLLEMNPADIILISAFKGFSNLACWTFGSLRLSCLAENIGWHGNKS
jgi:hypothetical protein